MTTKLVKRDTIEVNGTRLYHEVRGDGPPVVCISGATGDAGHFEPLAEHLADAYTVLTYDRRGNGRSPRPEGWTTTSVEEQIDDLVALVEALGLEAPVALGNSAGGLILVGALHHRPDALRGAVVHEPGLTSVAPSASSETEEFMASIGEAAGDPDAQMAAGFRWQGIDLGDVAPDLVARLTVSNAEVFWPIELPAFSAFEPDEDVLASLDIPVHAAYGRETPLRWQKEAAEWVAQATGGPLHVLPGGHMGSYMQPAEFADALRPILASMT